MSLLSLLATGTAAPVGSQPTVETIRAAIESALDPANYGGRVVTVGTDHATISGCLALADALGTSQTTRALVLIPPGTYEENIARPHAPAASAFVDVASTTLDPADVSINSPTGSSAIFQWEHYGTGGIVAGVTLNAGDSRAGFHCGEWHGREDQFIYYRCVVNSPDDGAWSLGIGPGLSFYLLDCEANCETGLPIYSHNFGAAAITARPAAGSLVFDHTNITQLPFPASTAGSWTYQDLGSGQDDLIQWRAGSLYRSAGVVLWENDTPSVSGWIDPAAGGTRSITAGIPVTNTLGATILTPDRLGLTP